MVFAKLDNRPSQEIVSLMVEINSSIEAWSSATIEKDSLWFKLARRFVSTGDKTYAKRLKIRFDHNRNDLKVQC